MLNLTSGLPRGAGRQGQPEYAGPGCGHKKAHRPRALGRAGDGGAWRFRQPNAANRHGAAAPAVTAPMGPNPLVSSVQSQRDAPKSSARSAKSSVRYLISSLGPNTHSSSHGCHNMLGVSDEELSMYNVSYLYNPKQICNRRFQWSPTLSCETE